MRIPRRPEDRIASETAPIRRYRCWYLGGCGWEGTLPAVFAGTVFERGCDPELEQGRMPAPAKSRFVIWAAIALTAIALGAGGVKLYSAFAPWSVAARNARTLPLGVSDFGTPLHENHPFLQQHIANSTASADDAPLSLREGCAWGEPGRNPYSGTAQQALKAAQLPPDVVVLLARKIRGRETSDRLEIRNDKIRGVHSNAVFEPRAIKLTYGKTLCLNSRVNFKPGHVERADLYEVSDARGITYSVMVPDVCGNVSVLGSRVERDREAQSIWGSNAAPSQPRSEGVQSRGRSGGGTTPLRANSVPEPETWTLMLGGLALLAWFTRRPPARSRAVTDVART